MKQQVKKTINRLFYKLYKYLGAVKHNVFITSLGTTSYCKHSPSCSHYFISQVGRHGALKGTFRGLKRILTCF